MSNLLNRNHPPYIVVLSIIFSAFSILFSLNGVFGYWDQMWLDVGLSKIWDPDIAYIGSSITFFDPEHREFAWADHPGTPMLVYLNIIFRGAYWVNQLINPAPGFYAFTLKNLQTLIFLSRLASLALHLLSFLFLYKFALRLLKNKDMALISVLAYSTALPVLHYSNKISQEPLAVLTILVCAIWLWDALSAFDQEEKRKGIVLTALSSIAVVTSIYLKVIYAPVLVPCIMFILFGRRKDVHVTLKTRQLLVVGFIMLFVITFAIGTYFVDWQTLLQFWARLVPNRKVIVLESLGLNRVMLSVAGKTVAGFIKMFLDALIVYRPGLHTKTGLVTFSEAIFGIFSIIGFIVYWRQNEPKRELLIWLIVFGIFQTPQMILASKPNYVFLHLAVASIFFGYGLVIAIRAIFSKRIIIQRNLLPIATLVTVIIHSLSIGIVVQSKQYDMAQFQNWNAAYIALEQIEYGDKIAYRLPSTNLQRLFNENIADLYRYAGSGKYKKMFDQVFHDVTSQDDFITDNHDYRYFLEYDADGVTAKSISN